MADTYAWNKVFLCVAVFDFSLADQLCEDGEDVVSIAEAEDAALDFLGVPVLAVEEDAPSAAVVVQEQLCRAYGVPRASVKDVLVRDVTEHRQRFVAEGRLVPHPCTHWVGEPGFAAVLLTGDRCEWAETLDFYLGLLDP